MNQKKKDLFIDIGNSTAKAVCFDEDQIQNVFKISSTDLESIAKKLNENIGKFRKAYVCSVVSEVSEFIRNEWYDDVHVFSVKDIPEKFIGYKTGKTLGLDRFFAAYAAWRITKEATIVIDAGTACTIDVISGDGRYQGGVIMPGLKIMADGLISKTSMLPETEFEIPNQWPPQSTKEALEWGITGSFMDAVKAHIGRHQEKYSVAKIVITGGDRKIVSQNIAHDGMYNELIPLGMKWLVEEKYL